MQGDIGIIAATEDAAPFELTIGSTHVAENEQKEESVADSIGFSSVLVRNQSKRREMLEITGNMTHAINK